ncbi:MAG TPA: hypothetical protein VKO61_00485 [Candidatus Paceibacterota bacterium]|nr:hypothetical protein [Candidatus Paceibacterota bacterium]
MKQEQESTFKKVMKWVKIVLKILVVGLLIWNIYQSSQIDKLEERIEKIEKKVVQK